MADDVRQETIQNPLVDAVGTIKWFNPDKGYGFIIPRTGGRDVLIHLSVRKQAKLEMPREGARIHFTYQIRAKGPHCMSVTSVDNSTAIHGAEEPWVSCAVKWWNGKRGFGFCTQADGKDIFIHVSQVKRFLKKDGMVAGERVEVQCETKDDKLVAKRLKVP